MAGNNKPGGSKGLFASIEEMGNERQKRSSAALTTETVKWDDTRRQTFYLSILQITALELMKAHENLDISPFVREALDKHIPQKYIQMAQEGKPKLPRGKRN